MTSGCLRPCEDVWNDVWLMEESGGGHIVRTATPHASLLRCGRLTPTFEDGDEAVKMLDENVDERKKNATSWDEMWRGATWLFSHSWRRKHTTWTPACPVRLQSAQAEKKERGVLSVLKANK